MMPDNKLALVESGWFPKTLQIYDSNYQYQAMLFSFLPCDNYGEANDDGKDQPLEMNVTYDVRFLTSHTLRKQISKRYNLSAIKVALGCLVP